MRVSYKGNMTVSGLSSRILLNPIIKNKTIYSVILLISVIFGELYITY